MNMKTAILSAGVGAFLALPSAAFAQPAPNGPPVPGYASQDQQIRGTVASLDGKYTVYVRDERGYVDRVEMHDGTVINPTGISLEPGQPLTIFGHADGNQFDANEIDTPAGDDGGDGYAVGSDAGYVAPYPYYSYYPGYALSYPTFISLGFGFGFGGGYYGHGGYGYGHGSYGGGYSRGYGSTGGYRGGYGSGFAHGGGGYAHAAPSAGFSHGGGGHR